jgi:hypothetical protein
METHKPFTESPAKPAPVSPQAAPVQGASMPNQTGSPQAPAGQAPGDQLDEETVRFKVEMDDAGRTKVACFEGKEAIKAVAVNPQGIAALIDLGLMRKPQAWKVGALHNWVELDGELFRLEKGKDGAAQLEKALNERYHPTAEPGAPPDIQAFPNPASPTGFDLQFSVTINGLAGNRRYHLNEETMELLQDSQKCRVLRKGTIVKLAAPNLVFKRKTADGGDRYLVSAPRNFVCIRAEGGQTRTIDLSHPLDLQHLGAQELTAVLNHPAINRRARLAQVAVAKGP